MSNVIHTQQQEVLLCSCDNIRDYSNISANIEVKYIRSAIREAQDLRLRPILGDNLIDKLKGLVKGGTIDATANVVYKTLIDKCQYLLIYYSIAELCCKVNYKIANAGVVHTPDDKVEVVSYDEMSKIKADYTQKGDVYARELQTYLLNNHTLYPELQQKDIQGMQSHLNSYASCGIFLGGPRGKKTL